MRVILAFVIFNAVGACLAAEITIVNDGKSDYVILIPPKAHATERFAGEELAAYIKTISGAQLVVREASEPRPKAIYIREYNHSMGPAERRAAEASPRTLDDYAIHVWGESIWIEAGSDRSAIYGVYNLLDSVGCRWLAPKLDFYHGSAEIIPQKRAVVVSDGERNGWLGPKLKLRKLYVEEGHSHTAENLKQMIEWMPKVGYNTLVIPTDYSGGGRVKWDNWREALTPELQKRGITIEVGGHGYQNFLNASMEGGTIFDKHPEWFGQDKQGVRHREHGRVFCTSNVAAVDYLTNNVIKYVKDRPEIQIFDFWPPDGAKWCECDNCEKLGMPSDRQVILVNHVKQKLNEAGSHVRLEIIAYAAALNPPEHQKLDKDVLVDFCPIAQQFDHQIFDHDADKNLNYVSALGAWRANFDGDISIYSYYRKYAWDSLPVMIPLYMQKDLQWYAKLPVQGVSSYAEPGDWATYELNLYVLAALSWDPDADVAALKKKFCDARYGEQSAVALNVLTTLEEVVRNCCSVPNTSLKGADTTSDAVDRVNKLLTNIPNTTPAMKRLALMCEYALRDLKIQELRGKNAPADEIKKQAQDLHAFLSAHADDGVFLIKDHRGAPGRLLRHYGINVKVEPGEGARAATRAAPAE